MGQKVNPIGLRLGINRNWESRWFPAKGRTAEFIAEDYKIRKFLKNTTLILGWYFFDLNLSFRNFIFGVYLIVKISGI